MSTVDLGTVRHETMSGRPAIAVRVTIAGVASDVYIAASRAPLATGPEPFVHVGLLAAMKLGLPLHIAGAVSPRLLRHVQQLQDIINAWYPAFGKVPVHAEVRSDLACTAPAAGVACFFSGGVDSSYTVLKRQAELTDLILVRGFDMRVGNAAVWNVITPPIRQAAQSLGKPLIEVETNVRSVLDRYAEWESVACGPALAGVALALAPQLARVYIAGSVPYRMQLPLGSHPLTDPLWSTENLEIVHDGGEMDRWGKLESLVASSVALQWLRVCYKNSDLAYNCGRCRKCLAVKCYLKAAGVLDDCPTFDKSIDLEAVAHMPIDGVAVLSMRASLLPAIERLGTEPEIANALRASITSSAFVRRMTADASDMQTTLSRVAQLEGDLKRAEARLARLSTRLHTMESSRSWRMTAPLRRMLALMHRGDPHV